MNSLIKYLSIFFLASFVLAGECLAKKSSSSEVLLPPKLAITFLESIYKNKNTRESYSQLTSSLQRQIDYSTFKKWARKKPKCSFGGKIQFKSLRQRIVSPTEGILYYIVQVHYSGLSFKKNFYALEKIKVIREKEGWQFTQLPHTLVRSEMLDRFNQENFVSIFTPMAQDCQQELLTYSHNQALQRSLATARYLNKEKKYRQALSAYEKVLKLDQNHSNALAERQECLKQISLAHENLD